MDKVLITGTAGFIGAHVAQRFLKEGFHVVGVDDFSSGRPENVPIGVQFIQGDLTDPATIASIPGGCKVILHLAGQSSGEISFDDPVADLGKNTVSTLNLIHYGIRHQAHRLVYASSMSVYGAVEEQPIPETYPCSPLSCYGVGKLAAEGYLRVYQKQLPFVALRMFNVYGPGQDMSNFRQGMVSIYLAQALANGRIEVKGGTSRYRDFIFIDDVVEVWYRAAFHAEAQNQSINVGTGVKTTVDELLQRICTLVPGSDYFVSRGTLGDQAGIHADISYLGRCLNPPPFTPLESGLDTFVEWASVQPNILSHFRIR